MSANIKRLGEFAKARREELDLTQEQVTDLGGPSDTKIGQIERGVGPMPSRKTLQKLDTGLGWSAGSAKAALMKGDSPAVARDPRIPKPDLTASATDPLDIPDLGEAMTEFMRQHSYRHGPRDVGGDA